MDLPFEYMDLVNYFTVDSVVENPLRFLLLWSLWFAAMFGRYLQLSYEFYKKYHKPFLGKTVSFEGMKHQYSNELLREEIIASFKSNLAIAFLYAFATPFAASEYGPVYLDLSKYGYIYLPVSFVLVALLHDMSQYWTHRAAHEWKWYYSKVHATHHRFKNPTPFSSWAMHPLDGMVNSSFVVAIIFVLPIHPLVYVLYIHWASYVNAVGHVFREEKPIKYLPSFISRRLGTGRMHIIHHKLVHVNYFYILQFWDLKFRTSSRFSEKNRAEKSELSGSDTDHAA